MLIQGLLPVAALPMSGPHARPRRRQGALRGRGCRILGPATTQNLVVKFDGEICGGVLVENPSDDFPQQKKLSKISFQTSPEVRHQFRRKVCQLRSGTRWCLAFSSGVYGVSRYGDHMRFRPGPSAETCRGLLLYKFWRILLGFSWRILSGHFFPFSHKNEEKKSGNKIREKIRRPPTKNP